MTKYKDLEKAIADYKEEMLQIKLYKSKIKDLENHLININSNIDKANKAIKNL